jgi:hypothetical protein
MRYRVSDDVAMLLHLLLACSDYALKGEDTQPGVVDTGEPPDTAAHVETGDDTAADTGTVPLEACNGVDDDGDGDVDEGFGDYDTDGVADCMDDCAVATVAEVIATPVCPAGAPTVADPWDVAVAWDWSVSSTRSIYNGVVTTPLVGQLTDDDGDGVVDGSDDLDVVVVTEEMTGGRVVVLDAATGAEHTSMPDAYYGGLSAIADVDGDGDAEILSFDGSNQLVAHSPDGTVLWKTEGTTPTYTGGMPVVAVGDLDGDGDVEVVAEGLVVDGATGATQAWLASPAILWSAPTVLADLDLDGTEEILYGGGAYAPDGTEIWPFATRSGTLAWPIVLQADADPEGEVLFVGDGSFLLRDTDGATIAEQVLRGSVGAPCVADFDGDGAVEVAVAANPTLTLYELDGTVDWTAPVLDSSSAAGCSAADLDGNGVPEIVYADEVSFAIFDGCTGDRLYDSPDHSSGTMLEYPTIVDVDEDGTAEILVSGDSTGVWTGLTMLEHAGAGWTDGADAWPDVNYRASVVDPEGAVVDDGTAWTSDPTVRSLPFDPPASTLDAALLPGEMCVAGCDATNTVQVAVVLASLGSATVPAGTILVAWRDDGGVLTEVGRATVPSALPGGSTSASVVFDLTRDEVGADGVVVGIDPPVAGDGDATDDVVSFPPPACP